MIRRVRQLKHAAIMAAHVAAFFLSVPVFAQSPMSPAKQSVDPRLTQPVITALEAMLALREAEAKAAQGHPEALEKFRQLKSNISDLLERTNGVYFGQVRDVVVTQGGSHGQAGSVQFTSTISGDTYRISRWSPNG